MKLLPMGVITIYLLAGCCAFAGTTWDGGGTNASLGTSANWNSDTLPAFNGTETLTFGTAFGSGTTLTLDGDRNVGAVSLTTASSIIFNPGTPATSKLTLTSGNIAMLATCNNQTHNEDVILGASGSFSANGVGTATLTMNGSISESTPNCSITKTSSRLLVLNGSNSFSGGVVLNLGSLSFGHDQALGTGTLRINAGILRAATARAITNNIDLLGSFSFGSGGSYGLALTQNAPGITTLKNNVTISVNQISGSLTFNNGITEDVPGRNLKVSGSREVVINGVSTFSGTFTIDALFTAGGQMATTNVVFDSGLLKLNADNPIGTGTVTFLGTSDCAIGAVGVRRDLDNVFLLKGNMGGIANLNGCDFNHNGGSSTLIGNLYWNLDQNGTAPIAPRFWRGIQESGGSWGLRILTGGATRYLQLGGTSTYSGPTTISRSILQVTDDNALPTNTALSIAYTSTSDGVFDMNGKATRIGSLSGTGYVMLGGGRLTVGGSANTTYAGYITGAGGTAGSGGLTRDGSGVLRLTSNTNLNYTGVTQVQGGTLQVDGLLSAAVSAVEVSGGTLGGTGRINRAVNVLAGGTIQAGLGTNDLGTLTIGSTLGTSNGAVVAWAVNAVTNDLIVANNMVQSGACTLKVLNGGATLSVGDALPVIRYTGTLTGFVPANWTIDLSESPVLTASRNARVYTNSGVIYLTGLQSPATPGTMMMIR